MGGYSFARACLGASDGVRCDAGGSPDATGIGVTGVGCTVIGCTGVGVMGVGAMFDGATGVGAIGVGEIAEGVNLGAGIKETMPPARKNRMTTEKTTYVRVPPPKMLNPLRSRSKAPLILTPTLRNDPVPVMVSPLTVIV